MMQAVNSMGRWGSLEQGYEKDPEQCVYNCRTSLGFGGGAAWCPDCKSLCPVA